jgi:ribosomal protein S18 acetylase RimI-like enzyme
VSDLDLPVLLELGAELREQVLPVEGHGRATTPRGTASQAALAQRYCEAIADPDRELVLAVGGKDGEPEVPLGMALFTVSPANALVDIPAVHMSHAVVAARHRKRGAGKALVAAAAAYAEERGIDQLVVSVHPGSRDAARFFARLGFAPQAVRRTAPVSLVRRRLTAGDGGVDRIVRQTRRRPAAAPAVARVDGADS